MLLEDPGIARVCDAPPRLRPLVAVLVEGGPADLEVGRRHNDAVLEVPGPVRRGRGPRNMSPEARARIAAAQKARWAKIREKKGIKG